MFSIQDAVGMIYLDAIGISDRLAKTKRWSRKGVWNRILSAAQERAYTIGKLNLEIIAVDSTLVDSKEVANPESYYGHKKSRVVKVHAAVA